jgi:hypothetical protein
MKIVVVYWLQLCAHQSHMISDIHTHTHVETDSSSSSSSSREFQVSRVSVNFHLIPLFQL